MRVRYVIRANVPGISGIIYTEETMRKISMFLQSKEFIVFSEPCFGPKNINKIIGYTNPLETIFDGTDIYCDIDFTNESFKELEKLNPEELDKAGIRLEAVLTPDRKNEILNGVIIPNNIKRVHSVHLVQGIV